MVAGGEHFAEPLCRMTCAAAPVLHPFTGRLEGVLDVTCAADDTSGLMLAFVREAAEEIRRRLEQLSSSTERALFESFLAAARRSSRPLLSVNGDLVIANAAAARLLEPADHQAVWEQVGGQGDTGRGGEIALVSGATYHADVVPIAVGDRAVGALVRLAEPQGEQRRRRPTEVALPGLVGVSSSWRALCRDAATVARSGLDAVVAGEVGCGKLAVAWAIHQLAAPGAPFTALDGAEAADRPGEWLDRLREAVAGRGTVVIRHLDLVPVSHLAALAAVCDGAAARLLATVRRRVVGGCAAPARRPLPGAGRGPATAPPARRRAGDRR